MKKSVEIKSYSFGKVKISNKEYNSDLIIFPEKILDNWWRKKGHLLQKCDLESVIEYNPDKLIIGTGKHGRMKVPQSLINTLNEKNISTEVYKTDKAIKEFNNNNSKNIVCALHLTC